MRRPELPVFTATGDLIGKHPLVEIVGQKRVLIENHQGVLTYSPEEILVKVNYGKITVTGCNLLILQISSEQLIIGGQINSLHLLGR